MIDIFTTGGTIDKVYFDALSEFQIGPAAIPDMLRENNVHVPHRVTQLMRKDSLDLTDADRELIAAAAREAPESRIVVTHGTDTMTDTAKVLAARTTARLRRPRFLNMAHSPYGLCQYVWYGRKRSGIYGHGRGKAAESKKYYGFYYICQPDCRCWGSSAFIGVYVAYPENFWRKWGNL